MADNVASEPLDWLWQRLQHLDASASPLLDIQDVRTSPFHVALKRWTTLLTSPPESSGFATVMQYRHPAADGPLSDNPEFVKALRSKCFRMAAGLNWVSEDSNKILAVNFVGSTIMPPCPLGQDLPPPPDSATFFIFDCHLLESLSPFLRCVLEIGAEVR